MEHQNRPASLPLLICLLGFPQLSETIYSPALPHLAKGLGIPNNLAEFTLSIYFVGFALGVLIYGILADRIGRRHSMLLGLVVYLIGSVGCSMAPSIQVLLAARLWQALGAAAGSVVTQTILRDLYRGSERQRVFSLASAALSFSPACGPLVGGVLTQTFHWRANFHALVLLGSVLIVWCLARLDESRSEPLRPVDLKQLARVMLKDRSLWLYALLIGSCNGIVFSYYAEAPFLFIDTLRLTPSQYGFLGVLIALSFIYAATLSLKLNRRCSHGTTLLIGICIALVGAACMSSVAWSLSPASAATSMQWALLLLAVAVIFVGIGIVIPNCLSHALIAYQTHSGSAGSLFGFAYYVMIAAFTGLMSLLHNATALPLPLYISAICTGMLVCGCRLSKRHELAVSSPI